jgi:hypothetical protein
MLNVKSPVLEKDIAKTTPPALLLFVWMIEHGVHQITA